MCTGKQAKRKELMEAKLRVKNIIVMLNFLSD